MCSSGQLGNHCYYNQVMFVNVASENGESNSAIPFGGNKLTEINTLINATRRLMIAIEINIFNHS